MMLRALASAAVILGCGFAGISFAARQQLRVRQIDAFLEFLKAIEFDIVFLRLPAEECLKRTASGSCGVIRSILIDAGEYLGIHKEAKFSEGWKYAAEKHKASICAGNDCMDILLEFAGRFGSGNDEQEKNNIDYTAAKLSYIRNGLSERLASDMKLYRGLGFLCGILIVILLF